MRNRFPPPPLKQLKNVLEEDWCLILLETVQNMYESIPRRIVEGKRWCNTILIKKYVQCL
jgi:hypothetical protein